MTQFWLGTHKPHWLWTPEADVPLFVSYRRLLDKGGDFDAGYDRRVPNSRSEQEVYTIYEAAVKNVETAASLRDQLADEEAMEEIARGKILSQSRSIPEGGREWEILMEKYLEEEWARKHEQ